MIHLNIGSNLNSKFGTKFKKIEFGEFKFVPLLKEKN